MNKCVLCGVFNETVVECPECKKIVCDECFENMKCCNIVRIGR